MLRGFFGNLIFAIIARMLYGNYLNHFSARRNASVLQLSGGYFDVLLNLLPERNRPHWNPLHFPDELYCPHLAGGGGGGGWYQVKWSHCLFFVILLRMIMFHSWHKPSLSRLFKCSCFPSLVCWRRWVNKEGSTGEFSWCLIRSF